MLPGAEGDGETTDFSVSFGTLRMLIYWTNMFARYNCIHSAKYLFKLAKNTALQFAWVQLFIYIQGKAINASAVRGGIILVA